MSQIEWAMWANEQAVASVAVLLVGSIIGVCGMFNNWQFGIYGIIASLFILLLEWPRGKRRKGNTMERKFQKPFTILVDKFGIAGRNYFIRFVVYLILCVPCCFILATVLGGVCLLITSAIYFAAAMKGEEWKPSGIDDNNKVNKKRAQSLHPPKKPPPRAAGTEQGGSTLALDNITMEISDETNSRTNGASGGPRSPAGMNKPTRPPPRPRGASRDGN